MATSLSSGLRGSALVTSAPSVTNSGNKHCASRTTFPVKCNWEGVSVAVPSRGNGSISSRSSSSISSGLMLERLEGKARAAAAMAAEHVIHPHAEEALSDGEGAAQTLPPSPGAAPSVQRGVLDGHRERLQAWWKDHLALRASTVEAATRGFATSKARAAQISAGRNIPTSLVLGREADLDKSRSRMQEFYYPRSDPRPFAGI
eukprot:TRINITY_DN38503_c0_g1_i1.p1 TRINITY_DN38503_c0_g1~~TRINITY_DN38503_c0_g1_i1.p1  ORF type:complete len:203 (+),score=45.48 TRINITY_DN38503_c0_g1_i1:210-818(+)